MTATSVTGRGPGDAHPGIKGPGNNRNVFNPLLSAHVVTAGRITLSGGVGTVTMATPLAGSESNFGVQLTSSSSATVAWVTSLDDDGDGNFASFDIAGGGTDSVMWAVIKNGVA